MKSRVTKLAYVFDSKTFEFVSIICADPDPMDPESWIKPFFSTFDAPPKIEKNQVALRNTKNDEWIVSADYRGTEYWDEDGTKHAITEVGEEVPEGALLEAPVIPPTVEQLATRARANRDTLLEQFTWRYERHAREMRLGIETTDSLLELDAYAQALADVPQQAGFPATIEWPEVPA